MVIRGSSRDRSLKYGRVMEVRAPGYCWKDVYCVGRVGGWDSLREYEKAKLKRCLQCKSNLI